MCGIHISLSPSPQIISPHLEKCLCNRGPDFLGKERRTVSDGWSLSFTSTVLALRGDHVTKQPLTQSANGSVLCWNGEAWQIGGRQVEGNDGEAILDLLVTASAPPYGPEGVLKILRTIQGPFAFVYYDAVTRSIFFGRDRLGRRSLMFRPGDVPGALTLSSISESCDPSWKEVEADGIYCLDCSTTSQPVRHDWLPGGCDDFVSPCPQQLLTAVQPR
jgi:asparagine synthetase B (glutamine-hydrolysing)